MKEFKNLLEHSVRLDIDAKDTDSEPIDVEIQCSAVIIVFFLFFIYKNI